MSERAEAQRRPRADRRERPKGAVTLSANLRADEQIRTVWSDSNSLWLARRASHREVASIRIAWSDSNSLWLARRASHREVASIRIAWSDSNSLWLARRASHREVASKSHRRPNPWGELRWSSEPQDQGRSWLGLPAQQDSAAPQGEHNIPKPVRRTWGLVNAAVVQGKIMSLPGEICRLRGPAGRRGAVAARVRGHRAGVSRGREPGKGAGERSEGSVRGDARELV
jgi:hypothetical protein